jgi:hypothetical protein
MFLQPNAIVEFELTAGDLVGVYNGPTGVATVNRLVLNYSVETVFPIAQVKNAFEIIGPFTENTIIQIVAGNGIVEFASGNAAGIQLNTVPALVLGNLTPVSIVQPAATFVTLTYQDNAGSVQLDSAGAHGLTAAIAVGNNVFVTWTGGTGVDGFYEVTGLDADTTGVEITIDLPFVAGLGTPTVAVANTLVTLASVTVPGWSMGVGGGMEIDALFTLTNTANAKNIGMTFGGGVLMAVAATSNASACAQKLMCNRGSSQVISNAANQVGHGLSTGANVVLNVDVTVDQTFTFTAQPAVANNVVILEAFKLYITF